MDRVFLMQYKKWRLVCISYFGSSQQIDVLYFAGKVSIKHYGENSVYTKMANPAKLLNRGVVV